MLKPRKADIFPNILGELLFDSYQDEFKSTYEVYWGIDCDLNIYSQDISYISSKIKTEYVSKIERTPYCLRIWFDRRQVEEFVIENFENISRPVNEFRNKRILIEHTSINPVHQLHIGAVRGSFLGEQLKRIFSANGSEVKTHFYVNDLGKQVKTLHYILSKISLETFRFSYTIDELIGVIYAMGNLLMSGRKSRFEELSLKYPDISELFTKTNLSKSELEQYHKGDKYSELDKAILDALNEDLKSINISLDHFDFESEYGKADLESIYELNRWIPFQIINGCVCIKYKDTIIPLIRSDGTTLYFMRDISYARKRMRNYDLSINVVGNDQEILQAALSDLLTFLGEKPLLRVNFGLIRDKNLRYSARQGKLLTTKMIREKYGDEGITNLKLNLCGIRAVKSIVLSDEHFSGARNKFFNKVYESCNNFLKNYNHSDEEANVNANLNEEEVWLFFKLVMRYSEIITRSMSRLELHNLVHYAVYLTSCYSKIIHRSNSNKTILYHVSRLYKQIITELLTYLGVEEICELKSKNEVYVT